MTKQANTPLGWGEMGILKLIYPKLAQALAGNQIGETGNKCLSIRYIDGDW